MSKDCEIDAHVFSLLNCVFIEKACTISHINGGSYIKLTIGTKNLRSGLGRASKISSSFDVLLYFHEMIYLEGLWCRKGIIMSHSCGTGMHFALTMQLAPTAWSWLTRQVTLRSVHNALQPYIFSNDLLVMYQVITARTEVYAPAS